MSPTEPSSLAGAAPAPLAPPPGPTAEDRQLREFCDALIHSRQHTGPKRLVAPGPDEPTLRELLAAAAAAPDHQQLQPWRDRKSTRLNSSHSQQSRMPSSA